MEQSNLMDTTCTEVFGHHALKEDLVINYSIKDGIMWGSTSANEVSVLEFSACNPETENWCAFGCNPEEARCAWHPSDRRL